MCLFPAKQTQSWTNTRHTTKSFEIGTQNGSVYTAYTTSLGRLPFNVFTSVRENHPGKKTKNFPGKFLLLKMSHLFFFFFYTTVTLSTEESNFYKGMTTNEEKWHS